MPISSTDVSDLQLTKKFSKIGAGDLIGALIEDDLGFSVAERVYRYMIEIKHKNNPEKLARWIAEYEALFQMNYKQLDLHIYVYGENSTEVMLSDKLIVSLKLQL